MKIDLLFKDWGKMSENVPPLGKESFLTDKDYFEEWSKPHIRFVPQADGYQEALKHALENGGGVYEWISGDATRNHCGEIGGTYCRLKVEVRQDGVYEKYDYMGGTGASLAVYGKWEKIKEDLS